MLEKRINELEKIICDLRYRHNVIYADWIAATDPVTEALIDGEMSGLDFAIKLVKSALYDAKADLHESSERQQ